jgi:hypothetical protein
MLEARFGFAWPWTPCLNFWLTLGMALKIKQNKTVQHFFNEHHLVVLLIAQTLYKYLSKHN